MNTIEDRLINRHKVMDRIMHNFPWLRNQTKNLGIKVTNRYRTDELPPNFFEGDFTVPDSAQPLPTGAPSIQSILETSGEQYPYTIFLGMCEDGILLTIDLTNPAPGALLIAGDTESGKTRLIRSILSSAAMISTSDQVHFFSMAANPHEYTDLAELDNCQKLTGVGGRETTHLIQEIHNELEKRRLEPTDPVILLAIDDLYQLTQGLEATTLFQLHRLIKHGPRYGIWVLASLSSKKINEIDHGLLESFRTRLLSYISDPVAAAFLARDESCPSRSISKGDQFCANVGGEWLNIWICDPAGGAE